MSYSKQEKKRRIMISVIVPVYNAESTILECIQSLRQQDFLETEYIIVNDGSIDKTKSMISKSIENDERFILIDQMNTGVSEARNRGLQHCVGKYIMFLDADDYFIGRSVLSNLFFQAEEGNYDVIAFGSLHEDEKHNTWKETFPFLKKEVNVTGCEVQAARETIFNGTYRTSVWNKFYRAELIQKHQISFYSYADVMSEDKVFNSNVFVFSKKILMIADVYYHYSVLNGSLSHQKTYQNVLLRNEATIRAVVSRLHHLDMKTQSLLFAYIYCDCLSSSVELLYGYNKASLKETKKMFSSLVRRTQDLFVFYKSSLYKNYFPITSQTSKNIFYSFVLFGVKHNTLLLSFITLVGKTLCRGRRYG